jgi:hypothetical protein
MKKYHGSLIIKMEFGEGFREIKQSKVGAIHLFGKNLGFRICNNFILEML